MIESDPGRLDRRWRQRRAIRRLEWCGVLEDFERNRIRLQLHPDKTRIVYCQDERWRASYEQVAEQGPQCGERLAARAAGERGGGSVDVGGGDLAQVPVVFGPVEQVRVDPVEVHPDSALVAGTGSRAAVVTGV
jgi:hypothetical protein